MGYMYQPARDRLDYLNSHERYKKEGSLGFHSVLHLKHHDRSEFTWDTCYYEFCTFDNPNDLTKQVKTIIIVPEHHPSTFYDLEDCELLEEVLHIVIEDKVVLYEDK